MENEELRMKNEEENKIAVQVHDPNGNSFFLFSIIIMANARQRMPCGVLLRRSPLRFNTRPKEKESPPEGGGFGVFGLVINKCLIFVLPLRRRGRSVFISAVVYLAFPFNSPIVLIMVILKWFI